MKIFTKVSIILIVFLLLLRLCLPYIICQYATHRINKIPDYQVHINDVSVALYRGSYTLNHICLEKISKKMPKPFFTAQSVTFSIEWSKLFKGMLVAEVIAQKPIVNFITAHKAEDTQLTINEEWQNSVKALFPLNFNKIVVNQGELHFQNFTKQPHFDLFLKDVHGELNNLQDRKLHQKQLLSSILILQAKTMDNATIQLQLHLDPFAQQPTFDLTAQLENMHVAEANNFLQHYTKIRVKQGVFSLYIEAAAANGKIKAYAKPIMKNLSLVEPKSGNPVESLYKGAVQLVTYILENPKTKTVATKINVSGNIENPDTSWWATLFNFLRHAFLQAFLPQIDHSIDTSQV